MCVQTAYPAPDTATCSILLVEDNPINQKVVSLMLSKYGIRPTVVDGGVAALEAIRNRVYDLILMDLHMPGMHGLEVSSRIRDRLGEACPPIVALTADAVFGTEERVLSQGLDGYITKPVSAGVLRSCIERFAGVAL